MRRSSHGGRRNGRREKCVSYKRTNIRPAEAEERCAQYFERCKAEDRLPTVPGLALALGLEGRRQLEELAQKEGRAAGVLRRGLSQVEEANIQAAYKRDSGTSARFILQNGFGYSEKAEAPAVGTIRVRLTEE